LPRKALAGLAGLSVVAAIAGCGGGDTSSSSSASASETAAAGTEKLSELQHKVRRLQAERRTHAESVGGQGSPVPPPGEPSTGRDSGGGSAQFRVEGDNSVQEFGREAPASERESAAAALHGFFDAWVAHRWKTACFYMSAGVVITLGRLAALGENAPQGAGCPQLFAGLSSGSDAKAIGRAAQIDVGSLRVKGERGFVLYHGAGGAAYAMPMARENGDWKVGALEGVPVE
jgi:hypothetical protein